ncbi:unnamed protein product [Arctogadus glacialis]
MTKGSKGRGREEREVGEKGQCRGRGGSSSEEGREEEIQGREGKDVRRARTFNSVDGIETEMVSDSSEEKGVEKKVDVKMIVRFAEEGGIGKMNPLKLTKELTGKCGVIKFARVLGDGNLLIGCSDELQVVLTKQLTMVGVNKVVKVVQVGMQRETLQRGDNRNLSGY